MRSELQTTISCRRPRYPEVCAETTGPVNGRWWDPPRLRGGSHQRFISTIDGAVACATLGRRGR